MLESTVDVQVAPERAFGIWTEQVGLWWPRGYSVSRTPGARFSYEQRQGGRLLERVPEGPEIVWARTVVYAAPTRLVYAFVPGGSGDYTSHVELTFEAHNGGTRVTAKHGLGQFTPDRWKSMQGRFQEVWDKLLPAYRAHANTTTIPTGSSGDPDDSFF